MLPVPPIRVELSGQLPSAVQAAILALVRRYEQRLQALQQQVNDLRQCLNRNSTNSSRPPSSDPPHVKRPPPKPASARKRGGQPGGERQQRLLVPPEQLKQGKGRLVVVHLERARANQDGLVGSLNGLALARS
jgi:transposase